MVRTGKRTSSDDCPAVYRKILKENIIHSGDIPILGLDSEYSELYNLVMRTVDRAESNSALVIGPRGCGKSSLVSNVMGDIKKNSVRFEDTILVSLNGYVHTDDHLSLKAITTQMKLENCVGDKVFGSFSENLAFLLQCLSAGNQKSSKSLIFILDEFDLFCNHRNQTLLYNLFDIAQSAQAPICVLGLTCRNDVTELLEKRVMSRFSNRQIHIYPEETEDKSFQRRMDLMKRILSIPKSDDHHIEQWNDAINVLCSDTVVQDCIRSMLEITHCENTFRNFLFLIVSKIGDNHPVIEPNDFVEAYEEMTCNLRVKSLEGLSVMELCLVIAMKHQTEIHDGEPFNFEMIYKRYLKFTNQNSMGNADRQVILKVFENLKRLEIIYPATGMSGQNLKEFQLYNLLVLPDEVREAVNNFQGLPTEVQQWAMSDLS